ncbi:hypothetical protein [Ideonella livida]|uniref:Uncharacterized protein n=1 Tax=Ideonella livida TaxID=2707176 RepID=A0A7C9PG83_9BURK|nr:hypothetical protein [Ideonella livida]NDY90194.1 hypothetical protein [Ideonella livida]
MSAHPPALRLLQTPPRRTATAPAPQRPPAGPMAPVPLSPAVQEAARQRAQTLRQAAVDDFWRGADALLDRGLCRMGRSARRLAAALRRRAP